MIWFSHTESKLFGDESFYGTEKDCFPKIESLVSSLLFNQADYEILKLCVNLLESIATKHIFPNGNKRTALLSLINLLRYFGLYLNKSLYKEPENLKYWEKPIIQIVMHEELISLNY